MRISKKDQIRHALKQQKEGAEQKIYNFRKQLATDWEKAGDLWQKAGSVQWAIEQEELLDQRKKAADCYRNAALQQEIAATLISKVMQTAETETELEDENG